MADRPILFSGPMVRALLDGRKTQTRRVLSNSRFASIFNGEWADSYVLDPGNASWRERDVRFAEGDYLYVREAWRTHEHLDQFSPAILPKDTPIFYEADVGGDLNAATGKFRQGMHMPRWASRLTLIVTDVRVQRLQDISEEDAIAEGFAGEPGELWPIDWYRDLWDSLNADRGYGWDANPWVVAVTFTVERRNIDEAAG